MCLYPKHAKKDQKLLILVEKSKIGAGFWKIDKNNFVTKLWKPISQAFFDLERSVTPQNFPQTIVLKTSRVPYPKNS